MFQLLQDRDLDIHMKDVLLPMIWHTLPSNLNCELEKGVHNVTVDADGTLRLCLRIRGVSTPSLIKLEHMFTFDNKISPVLQSAIAKDKEVYCKGCNHTCLLMSMHIDKTEKGSEDLIHLDRRT